MQVVKEPEGLTSMRGLERPRSDVRHRLDTECSYWGTVTGQRGGKLTAPFGRVGFNVFEHAHEVVGGGPEAVGEGSHRTALLLILHCLGLFIRLTY